MAKARRKAPRADPVYVALIGDVVGSRALDARRRARLQTVLQARLDRLNLVLGPETNATTGVALPALAARLVLTQGDEIQGLFRQPAALVSVIQELSDDLFSVKPGPPLRMRFGVGRGTLTTGDLAPPWAPNPALLDGSTFHRARGALERARDMGRWACFEGMDLPELEHRESLLEDEKRALQKKKGSPEAKERVTRIEKQLTGLHKRMSMFRSDLALEALFTMMGAIREDWTERQGAISIRFRERPEGAEGPGEISQAELAKALRVSRSVISETLKSARHNLLLQGEEAAVALLEALVEDEW